MTFLPSTGEVQTRDETLVNQIFRSVSGQQAFAGPPERCASLGQSDLPVQANATALLAEVRATCNRLLSTLESQPVGARSSLVAADADVQRGPRTSLGSGALKRLVQLRARRRRKPSGEFLDWPAWDMLLDLAAVRAEGGHVSVSSVCISSGAPQSTALRKLAALESANYVRRYLHGSDRRRVCLALTDEAADMVASALREEFAFYHGAAGNPDTVLP